LDDLGYGKKRQEDDIGGLSSFMSRRLRFLKREEDGGVKKLQVILSQEVGGAGFVGWQRGDYFRLFTDDTPVHLQRFAAGSKITAGQHRGGLSNPSGSKYAVTTSHFRKTGECQP
jgi:hypothetical protein